MAYATNYQYLNSTPISLHAPQTSSTTMSSSGGDVTSLSSSTRPLRILFSDQGSTVYEEEFGPTKVTIEANSPGVTRDRFTTCDGKTVYQTETRQMLTPTVTVGSKQFRELGTFQGEPTSRTSVCYRSGNSRSNTFFDSSPISNASRPLYSHTHDPPLQEQPYSFQSSFPIHDTSNWRTYAVNHHGSQPLDQPITVCSSANAFQAFANSQASPRTGYPPPTYLTSQLQRNVTRPYIEDPRRSMGWDRKDWERKESSGGSGNLKRFPNPNLYSAKDE